jgi:hypothetical protein
LRQRLQQRALEVGKLASFGRDKAKEVIHEVKENSKDKKLAETAAHI